MDRGIGSGLRLGGFPGGFCLVNTFSSIRLSDLCSPSRTEQAVQFVQFAQFIQFIHFIQWITKRNENISDSICVVSLEVSIKNG